ncbi:hypothetical protein S83_050929, partial [Arachis hypogaea]
YGDCSGTSGYDVSELMRLVSIFEGSLTPNALMPIELYVISLFSLQGIAPTVFLHCLKGDNSGRGIFKFWIKLLPESVNWKQTIKPPTDAIWRKVENCNQ